MSTVTSSKTQVFHTDLGVMAVRTDQVQDFDIEDVVSQRAYSQAMAVKLLMLSKSIDINAPSAPRTIKTAFLQSTESLD